MVCECVRVVCEDGVGGLAVGGRGGNTRARMRQHSQVESVSGRVRSCVCGRKENTFGAN